ncbi:hypothetical protein F8Y87_02100 [Vibrio alginolyticus]|nr:hypothetical protein [Vibrio alginolyticus]KYY32420.1 hypothetical protein AWQ12_19010 [Vibrio parahaemolyticus]OEA75214.1 hypothetical protein BBM68_11680 [Vibrio parahaemolyticus]OEA80503.1 hypothetical protein BBM67_05700 [Vibrio parahaemolyticus]
MLISYIKNHSGYLLDSKGYDIHGNLIEVPALLRNGDYRYDRYRGVINVFECDSFQRVKLVGFEEYSLDSGKTWIKVEKNQCLIGVRKWGEFYVVLFNGKPRTITYTPVSPVRYFNNVYHIHGPDN